MVVVGHWSFVIGHWSIVIRHSSLAVVFPLMTND
jgi:hypothetical protein